MGETARERWVSQEKKGELLTLGLNYSNSPLSLPYFQGPGRLGAHLLQARQERRGHLMQARLNACSYTAHLRLEPRALGVLGSPPGFTHSCRLRRSLQFSGSPPWCPAEAFLAPTPGSPLGGGSLAAFWLWCWSTARGLQWKRRRLLLGCFCGPPCWSWVWAKRPSRFSRVRQVGWEQEGCRCRSRQRQALLGGLEQEGRAAFEG